MVEDSLLIDLSPSKDATIEPHPGQIISFWHVERADGCSQGDARTPCRVRYVKRLIAQGPAHVELLDGKVQVDGVALADPAFDRYYNCFGSGPECNFDVPAGAYFVIGDNTRNSADSRLWGSVRREDLIGVVFLRFQDPNNVVGYYLNGDNPLPSGAEDMKKLSDYLENAVPTFLSGYCDSSLWLQRARSTPSPAN